MRTSLNAGLILIASLIFAGPALAEPPPRLITVTGTGSVEAVPDMATVTAGVETQADAAAAALAGNSEAMAAVMAALDTAGIAPADVQTSALSLDPVWSDAGPEMGPERGGPPRIAGFVGRNLVTIRVRDLDGLGALLDSLGAAGANHLSGISFGLDDPQPRLDAARREAVTDARARAALYATAAGVTLGPVVAIREGGSPEVPMMRAEAMAMAVPIAEGALTFDASVEMVFAIPE